MDLVSICVDVVQSCEGKAEVSIYCWWDSERSGGRTTYGCREFFVRTLGLFTEKDVPGLTAHRWRDSVKA